jgi:hypothetical protein
LLWGSPSDLQVETQTWHLKFTCAIDNICTLSANIKCICTSFRNRKKNGHWWAFLSGSRLVLINLIFPVNVCIFVFILQCHVFRKFLNLNTKMQKHLTFCWGVYRDSLFNHSLLHLALHKTQGTRRLCMSRRWIKQRCIRTSLYNQ